MFQFNNNNNKKVENLNLIIFNQLLRSALYPFIAMYPSKDSNEYGCVDLLDLEEKLKMHNEFNLIGCFSICSNVSGRKF